VMRDPLAVRVYRAVLVLLPRAVRAEDGEEIAATFAALWAAAGKRQRLRLLRRGFAGLAGAIVLEWWDRLRPTGRIALRRERRRRPMDHALRQVRQGVRSLARTPSFAWSAVLLLGLGVGSVTTIFTLVDHVLLRRLPYAYAERLFVVQNGSHSGPMFEDFQQFRSVEAWAAAMTDEVNLTGAGHPQAVRQARISRDFFAMFGARPALGRLPAAEEFRSGEGVVLSWGTWQRLFGAESDVVGRTIVVNGQPVVVVGVVAANFVAPEALVGSRVDLWRPIDPHSAALKSRNTWILNVAGRRSADATLPVVAAEADALAERRAREFPRPYTQPDGQPMPLPIESLQEATVGEVRNGLALFLGAVTLLLLVACTNVAHLFMARGLARTREMAVRRALGASMGTIAVQLLVESMLIAVGGALLGILLAVLSVRAFVWLDPVALPRVSGVAVDLRILGFASALAAGTALLFGLLPALRLVGRDVAGSLQSRGRALTEGVLAQRVRAGLVITEVALSIVLVTQAGLLLRSFARLHAQELGFRTEGIVTLPLRPTGIDDPEEWARRMEAIRASLAAVPGVQAATFGLTMPLEFTGGSRCCSSNFITAPGVDIQRNAMIHPVEGGYFQLFALRFVAGNSWQQGTERADPPPAVITEPLAIELFGSGPAALGHELTLGRREGRAVRIVGVVAANRHYGPDQEPYAGVYFPAERMTWASDRVHMAVLVGQHDDALPARLRAAVWRAEPDLPVPVVRPLREWAGEATAHARFESLLFTTFGAVALVLVAGGLYGTLLYSVGRRRRELGIRLALGDTPLRLERRVMSQGLRTAVSGCLFGMGGAWVFGRLLRNRLYGIEPDDPAAFAGALALLLLVTAAASWQPARRAASTDPLEALRAE
jgi:predicted permease